MRTRILLVDDDPHLLASLSRMLQHDCEVDTANCGRQALRKAKLRHYDCIVLDMGLPDIDGARVCASLRQRGMDAPIMLLSGDAFNEGVVNGIDGASGYYVKSGNAALLSVFIANVISQARHYHKQRANSATVSAHGVELQKDSNVAVRDGKIIELRPKEYAILECFLQSKGSVMTRDRLSRYAWQGSYQGSNSIEVHIKHLRDGIDKPFDEKLIHTVHGFGYRFGPASEGMTHVDEGAA